MVGLFCFAIGRDDLPDELVYQLVKAVFENRPRLVKATSAASETPFQMLSSQRIDWSAKRNVRPVLIARSRRR